MQNFTLIQPELVLYVEVLVAFILLVSYGLYKFSQGVRYRLWALGFTVYAMTAVSTIMTEEPGLTLTDSIGISGMLISSILLYDGARNHRREGIDLVVFPVAVAIGTILVVSGLLVGTTYGIVFAFVGIVTTFSCWYSALEFKREASRKGIGFWIAYSGFALWGVSTLLFIPLEMLALLDLQVLLIATGVIITGTGLLQYFIRDTNRKLETQYQITQLLGTIFQHDIRNYAGTLRESIEQARLSDSDREQWIDIASEIASRMTDFVLEMRDTTATMTRLEGKDETLHLRTTLDAVSERVMLEYGLSPEQIVIEVDKSISVVSCSIVKELFWNIFDNAFKHGTDSLLIEASTRTADELVLNIYDEAGGLPSDVREFLSSSDTLPQSAAPGVGLGIIIIRGLSLLCNIPLTVSDLVRMGEVVGTRFELRFPWEHYYPQSRLQANHQTL